MISLERIRKLDPELENFSDEELIKLRDSLYPIIEKIIDRYFDGIDGGGRPDIINTKRLDDNHYGQKDHQRSYEGNGKARGLGVRRNTSEKRKNERVVGKRSKSPKEGEGQ